MARYLADLVRFVYIHCRRTHQRYTSKKHLFCVPDSSSKDLCSKCSRLDFESIFTDLQNERLVTRGLGIQLVRVGVNEYERCILCELLETIYPWQPGTLYELRSFPGMTTYATWLDIARTGPRPVMLGSVTHEFAQQSKYFSGWLFRTIRSLAYLCPIIGNPDAEGPAVGSSRLKPHQIDFSVPRRWIQYCRSRHKTCSQPKGYRVVNFRLIDCENNTMVAATTDWDYVSLSYVWGPVSISSRDVHNENALPEKLPQGILDAISVTKRLGFRYLWVDRYCINQQCSRDKAEQIGQMDAIYSGATVTIVAASAPTPSTGLAGCGSGVSRKPQVHGKVGGRELVSTYQDPQEHIKESEWMQRGWTLQEALLSRRLLIFTPDQLYYECDEMQSCEAVDYTLSSMPLTPLFRFQNRWTIFSRLVEYSRRKMTFGHIDALNGFLGILRTYQYPDLAAQERDDGCCWNLWGSPIPMLRMSRLGDAVGQKREYVSLSTSFAIAMIWTIKTPGERRPAFPSWSWTGWNGELFFSVLLQPTYYVPPYIWENWDVEIAVEVSPESSVPIEAYRDSGGFELQVPRTHYIHVSSNTIPLTVIKHQASWMPQYAGDSNDPTDQKCLFHVRFQIPDAKAPFKYAYLPFLLLDGTITEADELRDCLGMLCSLNEGRFRLACGDMVWVVKKRNDEEAWERVGSFVPRHLKIFEFLDGKDVNMVDVEPVEVSLPSPREPIETGTVSEYRTLRLR